MGSVLSMRENYINFYMTCIEAFKTLSNQIIINVGIENKKAIINRLKNIPKNIKLLTNAMQIKILEKSKLFITHGGMGSFQESLYFGVKMIVIPHNGDQFMVAKLVEEKLLGLVTKIEITKEELLDLYHEINTNSIIENNCKEHKKITRSENGRKDGANALASFIEKILDYEHK